MGKVAKAFGVDPTYPPTNGNIRLNADLGNAISKPAGSETKLSEDFGGLTSPNTYP